SALGAVGLPVFTPSGLPGLGRLLGPNGRHLLALPVAAFAVGRVAGDGKRWGRLALALLAGLTLIHLGGLAQLLILTGSVTSAVRLGTLPFLLGDLLKLGIAILVLRPTVSPLRARPSRRAFRSQTGRPARAPLPRRARVVLGAGTRAGAAGLAVLVGCATFRSTGDWAGWGGATLPLGSGFLLAAITEELAFRGYPLRRLADALGAGPATSLG